MNIWNSLRIKNTIRTFLHICIWTRNCLTSASTNRERPSWIFQAIADTERCTVNYIICAIKKCLDFIGIIIHTACHLHISLIVSHITCFNWRKDFESLISLRLVLKSLTKNKCAVYCYILRAIIQKIATVQRVECILIKIERIHHIHYDMC